MAMYNRPADTFAYKIRQLNWKFSCEKLLIDENVMTMRARVKLHRKAAISIDRDQSWFIT